MKKILVSLFLLVFGLCLVGCDISDNTEKPSIDMLYSDWYNCAKLPTMEDPFTEVYDGCYTIKIDENNNVLSVEEKPKYLQSISLTYNILNNNRLLTTR